MNKELLVVIGAGGIGRAIARRQGAGKLVLLADFSEDTLQSAANVLEGAGHMSPLNESMCRRANR